MSKVLQLNDLGKILRESKKKTVLCHGVFDLFHYGHLRHLQEAKNFGETLVVTVTPDLFVNKGPHRPIFNAEQRAHFISSLDFVDYVAINSYPNAVETIRFLQPNFFVKGAEFKDKSDIDGAVLKEKEAVESYGGKMVYTSDSVVFSSSNLINSNFNSFSEETNKFLEEFRFKYSLDVILNYIDQLSNLRVLIIGEAILDEYVYGKCIGKSSKDPTLVMEYEKTELYAGGSLAVSNHIADFVKEVELITYLGDTDPQEEFIKSSLKDNINLNYLVKENSRTIIKRRFIDSYFFSKLLEVYRINQEILNKNQENYLMSMISEKSKQTDLIVVSDFGHGLMTKKSIRSICASAKFLALNVQANAGNFGYNYISKYPSADYVAIDEKEIRLETRNRDDNIDKLLLEAYHKIECNTMMVTRGSNGSVAYNNHQYTKVPSLATKVVDRVGAGDAFFAISSLLAYLDAPMDVISFIGNVAGSIAVTIVGNKTHISKNDLKRTIISLMK